MANPNGRKGSKYEVDVRDVLRDNGAIAERLVKAGAKDEGDLYVFLQGKTYILELKNRKKLDLPAFWDEAQAEAKNYAKARKLATIPPAFVVVKRRQHGIEKSWVIQDLEQWIRERNE